jgi:hypothetical protein
VKVLSLNNAIPKTSRLISLKPFLDKNVLISVGGRIRRAPVAENQKHPVVLPHNHHVTELFTRKKHIKLFHAGPQTRLCSIRQRFQPLNGQRLVRRTVNNSVACFKAKPRDLLCVFQPRPNTWNEWVTLLQSHS